MNTYNNSVVVKFDTKVNGNAGVLTPITVYLAGTETAAQLYDSNDSPVTQPIYTDENGNYTFNVEDGFYDIVIKEGFLSEERLNNQQIATVVPVDAITGHYDTLQDAISAPIIVGQIITTTGYHTVSDGGAGQYIVVVGGTGTDDGGSYLDMTNGNQLQLITKGVFNVKAYGAKGDNTDATSAIQSIKDLPEVAFLPNGIYPDSRNGEGYIYSSQLKTDGGDYRYSKGGTLDLTNDPTPVMMIEKIFNTEKAEALTGSSFDGGALIIEAHKKGGDAFVCGMTSNVRSVSGGGDAIGGHFRSSGFEPDVSEIFGGWIYANAAPTDVNEQILEAIGLEINMRNQGKVPAFNVEVLPPESTVGDYRLLNVLTADGSNGVNIGIDVGAQGSTGSDGYFMGIRMRADGCVPSATNPPIDLPTSSTCQICIQGSKVGPSSSYAGINMPVGNFTWGINLEGGIYNDGAINIPSNSGYYVGETRVVRSQRTGYGSVTGAISGSAWDTSTATTADVAKKLGALWTAIEQHGLIGA